MTAYNIIRQQFTQIGLTEKIYETYSFCNLLIKMKSSDNDSSEDASSGECNASVPDLL